MATKAATGSRRWVPTGVEEQAQGRAVATQAPPQLQADA